MSAKNNSLRLEDIAAQARSLSMLISGEAFKAIFEADQDNVLWLLSDLTHEIDQIVNKRS